MELPNCPACQAAVTNDAAFCPRCGAALATSAAAQPAKKRFPTWAWVLIGVGCGCPAAIVLLGLLATLIIPNVMEKYRSTHDSGTEKAKTDIAAFVSALSEYAIRNAGTYPDSLEALVAPDENGYRFLQSQRLPRDPWKQEYQYDPPLPDSGEFEPHVWSLGKDRISGTADDIDSRMLDED